MGKTLNGRFIVINKMDSGYNHAYINIYINIYAHDRSSLGVKVYSK